MVRPDNNYNLGTCNYRYTINKNECRFKSTC